MSYKYFFHKFTDQKTDFQLKVKDVEHDDYVFK